MDHFGTRGRERERADAGITEQIQRFRLGHAVQLLAQPRPDRRHVGEEAEVTERRVLRGEAHGAGAEAPGERPAVARHGAGVMPLAAAILVAARDEFSVRFPVVTGRRPERLRLGADKAIVAVALQLATMAAIDEAVIAPGFTDERVEFHGRSVTAMLIDLEPPGGTRKMPGLSTNSPA